jgi:hypothetical protein
MENAGRRALGVAAVVCLSAAYVAAEQPPSQGYPFKLNALTVVDMQVGPVQLKSATFRQPKPDEFESLLDFYCVKGKDQSVTYEIAFLDGQGATVLTIKDVKGIEETDNNTFKNKRKIPAGFLSAVQTFKVTFSSVPD